MELRLRHDFFHSDQYALVTGLDEREIANQEPFTINNASIGLGDMDGGWEVRFWGRNIFEEDYVKGGFPSVGLPGTSFNRYPGDPRTYGVTLRVRR
jgi:outer membrane receptor protein involved in Fe transport